MQQQQARGASKGRPQRKKTERDFEDRVVQVRRVSKTVKGGRKMSFTALVVIGNKRGMVGVGLGKANEVKEAVRKGVEQAKKASITIELKNDTIPYQIEQKFKSALVFLRPASEGTGVIAGGATRTVLELVGVKDILTKQIGSANPINNAWATIEALKQLSGYASLVAMRKEAASAKSE